jgi:hypothetical protein
MSSPPPFSPSDSPLNPPASTGQDAEHAAPSDDPEVVRRAHLTEESYVKALGIINYIYFFLFGSSASYWLILAIQHATGRISAPWVLRPGWIAVITDLWITTILAGVAGYGLRRLRPWALVVEALFVLCWLIWYFLGFVVPTRQSSLLAIIGGTAFLVALAAPMLNLGEVRHSVIFDRDYRRIIKATPSIRARAKLPRELWLIAVLFLIVGLVLIYIGVKQEKEAGRPAKAAGTVASVSDRRMYFDCV